MSQEASKLTAVPRFIPITLALACGVSLLVTLAPTQALQDRLVLVDLNRSIRPIGESGVLFVRLVSAAICFLGVGVLIGLKTRGEVLAGACTKFRRDALRFQGKVTEQLVGWFRQSSVTERFVLLTIFAIGVAHRLQFLPQPMGYDESISFVYFISRSFLDIASDYSIPNNHVFHNLLARASFLHFGANPMALRLPAFLAGVILIPATYWLARRLYDDTTALLAAGLVSVAPAIVEYSSQARGYTISTLCFVVALISASYLVQRRSVVGWTVFGTAFVVALYTLPPAVLGLSGVCIWTVATADRQRRSMLCLELPIVLGAVALVTLALYSPILARSGLESLVSNTYVQPATLSELAPQHARTLESLATCWTGALRAPWSAVFWVGAAVAVVPSRITNTRAGWSLLLSIAVGVVGIVLLRQLAPPPRTLHFAFPAVAAVSAHGLMTIYKRLRLGRWSGVLWPLLVLAISLFWAGARIRDGGSVWFQARNELTGYESVNSCAEGYFPDAEGIVNMLREDLERGGVMYAHVYSGIVEPLQYYLLDAGFSPVLAQPYRPQRGPDQLQHHESVNIIVKRQNRERKARRRDVLSLLRLEEAAYDTLFSRPLLIARFLTSDVYRLEVERPYLERSSRKPGAITYPR